MEKKSRIKSYGASPLRRIVAGFILIIIAGTLLLMLPAASASGKSTDAATAAFTSVSATCVTGLVRVDTALHWSFFGQAVILSMIQLGGVGFMSVTVMLLSVIRHKVTLSERLTLANSFGVGKIGGIMELVRKIVFGTLIFELAGAVILSIRFIPKFGFFHGLWMSIFHSVSAFCNAGFDILGNVGGEFSSMSALGEDPTVLLTLSALIVIGGIGFVVWNDIYGKIRYGKRIGVYSRLVLTVTLSLLIIGTLGFFAAEHDNPQTLGGMSFGGKILSSVFHSATTRTAGFAAADLGQTREITKFMFLFLMFVGGSSGSTAGGIKTATLAVLAAAIISVMRGKRNTVIMKRTIPQETVRQALALAMIQLSITLAAVSVLIGQGIPLMESLFECVSASATVGLSLSVTPVLPIASEICIMLLMFIGRLGILTLAYAMKRRASDSSANFEYASVDISVG